MDSKFLEKFFSGVSEVQATWSDGTTSKLTITNSEKAAEDPHRYIIASGHLLGYGEEGRGLSWQLPFPKEVKCCHCGKEGARLAFVFQEKGGENWKEKEFACRLHANEGGHEGFWLHDAAAFAVYICRDIECAQATTKWNQA